MGRTRSGNLPNTRVLPETEAAFKELEDQLGISATRLRLESAASVCGHIVLKNHGHFGSVIKREMER